MPLSKQAESPAVAGDSAFGSVRARALEAELVAFRVGED